MTTNFTTWEFKLVQGAYSDVQKWLNQWRHEFELQLHEVKFWTISNQEGMTILLSRRKIS